jgi:hypothetical protein
MFGQILGEQFRVRFIRTGADSFADARPDSVSTAARWDDPRTRQLVEGVLGIAHDLGPSDTLALRGFTLSTNEAGYVANRAVHHFRNDDATAQAYEAAINASKAHVENTAAVRKGGWLHLDPQRSAGLLRTLDGGDITAGGAYEDSLGRGVKTLLHELNHVASPRPRDAKHLDWLSEGSAEALARWPGRVEAAGERLGVTTPRGVGSWFDAAQRPYQHEVDAVRGLIALADIDASNTRHFETARRILNDPTEDLVPAALARHITEVHELSPRQSHQLAVLLEDGMAQRIAPDGSHVDPARLDSLLTRSRRIIDPSI